MLADLDGRAEVARHQRTDRRQDYGHNRKRGQASMSVNPLLCEQSITKSKLIALDNLNASGQPCDPYLKHRAWTGKEDGAAAGHSGWQKRDRRARRRPAALAGEHGAKADVLRQP